MEAERGQSGPLSPTGPRDPSLGPGTSSETDGGQFEGSGYSMEAIYNSTMPLHKSSRLHLCTYLQTQPQYTQRFTPGVQLGIYLEYLI